MNLRKSKGLSQEEVAEKLNVTRQTVSKWETNQSTPDFDKIIPLCELYDITSDELLKGKGNITKKENNDSTATQKKAFGIGLSILLYFISIIWIIIAIPVIKLNPLIATAVFLTICAIATAYIVYTCIVYKNVSDKKENSNPVIKRIEGIISIITVIIYLGVSFLTKAWNITWIIWLVYALVMEIVKLVFYLRGIDYEE